MRTRYGISPWVDLTPAARRVSFDRLRGEGVADVVIVGGGLTGCLTAYACATAGFDTVVLERDRIGQGASGRSSGLLVPDPGPTFRDIERALGRRSARKAFEGWRRATSDAAALLRRLKIPCGLELVGSSIVARRDAAGLERECRARAEAELDATWATGKTLTPLGVPVSVGALRHSSPAVGFDPYRACLGVVRAARAKGVRFFERTEVTKAKPSARHVDVVVDGGVVRAATVVVATGVPTMVSALNRHFKARETYHVLTDVLPAPVRRTLGVRPSTFRDIETPPHQVRWTSDHRVLVSGAMQDVTPARTREKVLVQRTGQLMYELLTMFPDISGLAPAYGWESASGETTDGLPYIGPHRFFPRHLFALGGADHSLTSAFLAARVLVRALQQAPDQDDAVWAFTRH